VPDWVLSRFSEDELIEIDNNIYNNSFNLVKEKI
jgi:hypothetical protein